jgi:Uri superfamily endonuclease
MTDHMAFPAIEGTYILWLQLHPSSRLTIGKRGTFDFPAGWYAYVGSAMARGGLRGRLKHHLSPVKNPHWHIDYVRAIAPVAEVWYLADASFQEHQWAAALRSMSGASLPAPGFGSSDCLCPSHLIQFTDKPSLVTGWRVIHEDLKAIDVNQ